MDHRSKVGRELECGGNGRSRTGTSSNGKGGLSLGVSATAFTTTRTELLLVRHGGYFSQAVFARFGADLMAKQGSAVAYEISASAGMQSIKEDAAPVLIRRSRSKGNPSTGSPHERSNSNVATRFAYRFSPHSSIEAFATAKREELRKPDHWCLTEAVLQ